MKIYMKTQTRQKTRATKTRHTQEIRIIDELQEAQKQMKNRKTAGPDTIKIELVKYGELLL